MTGAHTVAVIMPFKNAGRFIAAAVESVLTQTHRDLVLFAINDHSDDDSEQVVRDTADDRVRILQSPGHGPTVALNEGLRYCDPYKFIVRQDADDLSEPDRFARQLAFMHNHPRIDVLAGGARWLDESGDFLLPGTPAEHDKIVAAMKDGNPICQGTVMLRNAVLRAAGGYDTDFPVAQGYDLWVRLAVNGAIFAALPDVVYQVRARPDSWSVTQTPLRVVLMEQIRKRAQGLLP